MSFWGSLGKGLLKAAPFAAMAIPGVGPALGGVLGSIGSAGGGMVSKMASGIGSDIMGAAGAAIGGAADASAKNRGAGIEASVAQQQLRDQESRDYNNGVIAREEEGRASGNDALKNLMRTQYIQKAEGYTPQPGMKSFGFGPQASTDEEKAGAAAYGNEAMARLTGGNQIPELEKANYTIDPKLLKSGMLEKIGGIAGPGLSMLGLLSQNNGSFLDPRKMAGKTIDDIEV